MRTDTLPDWPNGVAADLETAVEVTLTVAPYIDWDAVEERWDVTDRIREIIEAFCVAHRDTDWVTHPDGYALALDQFVLDNLRTNQPDWVRKL